MLLYALYNFVIELADIFRILFKIIFYLPFRILHVSYVLRPREALALIKGDIQFYFNQLKMHGLTFSVSKDVGEPKVQIRSYEEEIAVLADTINRGGYQSTKMFMKDVFTTMAQCRYAVISDGETDRRFIQYRSDSGTFMFDFPMCPDNINGPYSMEVLALLRKLGFRKYNRVTGYSFLYKTYTIYPERDNLTTISANFGTDWNLVVRFSTDIFNRIFKSSWIPNVTFG